MRRAGTRKAGRCSWSSWARPFLFAVIFGATAIGLVAGGRLREGSEGRREPTAAMQRAFGAAAALALLPFYVRLSQRGVLSVLVTSLLVTLVLLVIFDLAGRGEGS